MNRARLARVTRDPFAVSVLLALGFVVAGFVAIAVAWRGVARLATVAGQVPFLLSGAMGGVALVAFGLALVDIQLRRRTEAEDRAAFDRVLAAAAALVRGAEAGPLRAGR